MSTTAVSGEIDPRVSRELWSSFVSLIRSYTAAHGLNGTRQAVLEVSEDHLLVRAGERLLAVRFDGERGSFARESGPATEQAPKKAMHKATTARPTTRSKHCMTTSHNVRGFVPL